MMLDGEQEACQSVNATDAVSAYPETCAPCGRNRAWYVIRTGHRAERLAAIGIGQAVDLPVFSPSLLVRYQPARRYSNGSVRAAIPQHVEPVFRRYIFVQFSVALDPWRAILRQPGVETIISTTPENPTAVPQSAMDGLRARVDAVDVMDPLAVPPSRFTPGVAVRVIDGPFGGHVGLCQMSASGRVRLLLSVMGRDVPVSVPQASVAAI